MTNSGDSMFGPATGKQVRIMNMADCVIEDAVIVREWLARDNLALVRQLGFRALDCAGLIKASHSDALTGWIDAEHERLTLSDNHETRTDVAGIDADSLLRALWLSGDETVIDNAYHSYAVMHRSPVEIISGRNDISAHFKRLRRAFDCRATIVDHTRVQSAGRSADHVAIRWAVSGTHSGDYVGIKATGKPVFIMGVTHRRIIGGRVAVEWTVFDTLGVMAQLL